MYELLFLTFHQYVQYLFFPLTKKGTLIKWLLLLPVDISGVLSNTYQSIDIQLLSDLLGGVEGKRFTWCVFVRALMTVCCTGTASVLGSWNLG